MAIAATFPDGRERERVCVNAACTGQKTLLCAFGAAFWRTTGRTNAPDVLPNDMRLNLCAFIIGACANSCWTKVD